MAWTRATMASCPILDDVFWALVRVLRRCRALGPFGEVLINEGGGVGGLAKRILFISPQPTTHTKKEQIICS